MPLYYQCTFADFEEASGAASAGRLLPRGGTIRSYVGGAAVLWVIATATIVLSRPAASWSRIDAWLLAPAAMLVPGASGLLVLYLVLGWRKPRATDSPPAGPKLKWLNPKAAPPIPMRLAILAGLLFVLMIAVGIGLGYHPRKPPRPPTPKPDYFPPRPWSPGAYEMLLLQALPWGGVGLLGRIAYRRASRRTLESQWAMRPALAGTTVFDFTETGFCITRANTRLDYRWPAVLGVVETENLILISADTAVHMVPKRALATPQDLLDFIAALTRGVAGAMDAPVPVEPIDVLEQNGA